MYLYTHIYILISHVSISDFLLKDWSDCSVTCGIGNHSRTREVNAEVNGGAPCDPAVPTRQSEECSAPCPRDCVWGDWGAWTRLGTRSESTIIKI